MIRWKQLRRQWRIGTSPIPPARQVTYLRLHEICRCASALHATSLALLRHVQRCQHDNVSQHALIDCCARMVVYRGVILLRSCSFKLLKTFTTPVSYIRPYLIIWFNFALHNIKTCPTKTRYHRTMAGSE